MSGAIGVFVLPSRGIARSCHRWFNKNDHVLFAPRLAQSKADASLLSIEQQATFSARYDEIVRSGAHARKKTLEKRMRKWFLGDEKAFAVGLDEMGDDTSEAPLSRTPSGTSSPRAPECRLSGESIDSDPPPRFSAVYGDEGAPSTITSPRGSVSSTSRQPLGYQQRKQDRIAQRSSISSPLSGRSPTSPPPFSATDPHPPQTAGGSAPPTNVSEDDTSTVDSEVMRDLKDMYISGQHQL